MSIRYKDVFSILAKAMPGFEPSAEEYADPTPYFFLGEMVEFVCKRAESGSMEEVESFGALLEVLLSEGDSDVRDLVQDALETVRDCDVQGVIPAKFGPRTNELWRQVSLDASHRPPA